MAKSRRKTRVPVDGMNKGGFGLSRCILPKSLGKVAGSSPAATAKKEREKIVL